MKSKLEGLYKRWYVKMRYNNICHELQYFKIEFNEIYEAEASEFLTVCRYDAKYKNITHRIYSDNGYSFHSMLKAFITINNELITIYENQKFKFDLPLEMYCDIYSDLQSMKQEINQYRERELINRAKRKRNSQHEKLNKQKLLTNFYRKES